MSVVAVNHGLFLGENELTWLLGRLGDDPHRLKKSIQQGLRRLRDKAEQLKEITFRTNANAFWEEEQMEQFVKYREKYLAKKAMKKQAHG